MTDSGEFIAYYKKLPKAKGTCYFYERNDVYSVYDADAVLINQEILKASKLKIICSGDDKLSYVNLNKSNFVNALKHLLFVLQYKIEILKNVGSARAPQWVTNCKASPGNLTQVEDFLFGDSGCCVQTASGLLAVKMISDGPDIVFGIAFCDTMLRKFEISQITDGSELTNLQSLFVQLSPQECILPSVNASIKQAETSRRFLLEKIIKAHGIALSECRPGDFSASDIDQDLNRLLRLEEGTDFKTSLKDEFEMKYALAALACIIKYLELLGDDNNFGQFTLSSFKSNQYARVDVQSIAGLGLFPENPKDFYDKNYLLGHLNSCHTSQGERLLIQWIKQPLIDIRRLEDRFDVLEIFVNDFSLQNETSKCISKFPDIEALSRKLQRRKASLQDLYKVYMMVKQLPELNATLLKHQGPLADVLKLNFIDELQERTEDFTNLECLIESVLDFEAVKNREFIVKAEFDETLLELQKKITKVQNHIQAVLENVKDDLDPAPVKLDCSDSIGYCFRLTRKEERNLRNKKNYMIIDTKASGVRFQNSALKNLNEEYLSLRKSYEEMQKGLVDQIIDVAVSYILPMKQLSQIIARLDLSLAFARVSVSAAKPYVRPKLKEKGNCQIVLKQARHPVLETKVENFIPNDVELTKDKFRFYFVTGPNMGGKSTYIRSVALNVLLAQIGCFVPCDEAEISVTDAFLTRIGACDKPSKAISTFMFEMLEVQNIIKTASSDSLLIIDEMGRGTSTYDGFGLSWAISRHIAEDMKAACLFATHFHELTDMSKSVAGVGNLFVEAISSDGDIIFLYRVKPGVCDESFGIHVAKLAKFPETVIKKAEEKLIDLDKAHFPLNSKDKHSELSDRIFAYVSQVSGAEGAADVSSKQLLSLSAKLKDDKCVLSDGLSDEVSSSDNVATNAVNEITVLQNVARILEEMVKERQL